MTKPSFGARLRNVAVTYVERVGSFHPNARLYLLNAIIAGAAFGVYRLLFNFFVLSMNYDETLLGSLITTSSLTALIVALPMGYLADMIGRKTSLLLGSSAVVISVVVMVLFPSPAVFIGMNVVMGFAQSLTGVTMGPFLMENSSEKERTYLFSFASGLSTASALRKSPQGSAKDPDSRAIALPMVKWVGPMSGPSSSQDSGIETGAPARARAPARSPATGARNAPGIQGVLQRSVRLWSRLRQCAGHPGFQAGRGYAPPHRSDVPGHRRCLSG